MHPLVQQAKDAGLAPGPLALLASLVVDGAIISEVRYGMDQDWLKKSAQRIPIRLGFLQAPTEVIKAVQQALNDAFDPPK